MSLYEDEFSLVRSTDSLSVLHAHLTRLHTVDEGSSC
jgi:hypothetical protein